MRRLTHLDESGKARMVDVTAKPSTKREAAARGSIIMNVETLRLVKESQIEKGDVLSVARLAGIMAAKKTSEIIPLCHPLQITSVSVEFGFDETANKIFIESRVRTAGRTGVEMEALTAVSAAALTIYDMCKAVDKEMIISDIFLMEKKGGKSGLFRHTSPR
jgi:cyclic pyranopterin phosphate synthase